MEEELSAEIEKNRELLEEQKLLETKGQKDAEDAHLERVSLEQKNDFLLENKTRIEEEITKFEEELRELADGKNDASREIQEKENQIQSIRQTIENTKEVFEEIEKEIEEAEGQENRKLENQKDVRQLNEMSHAFCDYYKGVGILPTPLPEDKKSVAPD